MICKEELLELVRNSNSIDDYLKIVRKYIIHGIPFVFKDNTDAYYEFREMIAKRWNVRFNEVLILGSGKLGYSYHKDSVFSTESDIDVAIVSKDLFEDFYLDLRDFQYKKEQGILTLSYYEESQYRSFLTYMIKGWMRPDKLPTKLSGSITRKEWFDYFKSISYNNNPAGNYKIAAGLFKDFNYMEWYYVNSLMSLK